MNYPTKDVLKTKLKTVCTNDGLCELIAVEFAEKKISCSHRVAQRKTFELSSKIENVDTDEVGKCSEVLCSYVDDNHCTL